MANNYTDTSFIVLLPNKAVQTQILNMLEDLSSLMEEDPAPTHWPINEVTSLHVDLELEDYCYCGFNCEAANEHDLWVYGDESVNVDQIASFFEWVMYKFQLPEPIAFMWADYCSKPRLGEQGGGACFITQDGTRWMSTYGWLEKQKAEFHQ
jgi:hypothetical protein